jgi:hypothetical protein
MVRSRTTALIAGGIVLGVLGAILPGATASAHSPTASPTPRYNFALAGDDALGQVVLFGGGGGSVGLGDTWTWDGTSWTKRFPAHSPSPRAYAKAAYDAATGQFLLFGGFLGSTGYTDTWTWDGADWTQLHPAHSPPPSVYFMTYDAARGQILLFTGTDHWTWDGTDWTEHAGGGVYFNPGGFSYDGANGEVVAFGGTDEDSDYVEQTYTWDGNAWTYRQPLHSPKANSGEAMTYDAALGRVLMWGGRLQYHETWTWDGTDWQRRDPAHYPVWGCGKMAYDAVHREAVLVSCFGATWTFHGKDWTLHPAGGVSIAYAHSGPPGTTLTLGIWGWAANEQVRLSFVDSKHTSTFLKDVQVNENGDWMYVLYADVPAGAAKGKAYLVAEGLTSHMVAKVRFNVT